MNEDKKRDLIRALWRYHRKASAFIESMKAFGFVRNEGSGFDGYCDIFCECFLPEEIPGTGGSLTPEDLLDRFLDDDDFDDFWDDWGEYL